MLPESLGHYRIVRLLGRGGMGEVYLAEDLTLGRQVALKLLPPDLVATGRERFEREARAVAALNHPDIVTLHSIDQSGETPFLTMEFVDGKPLTELIPPGGLNGKAEGEPFRITNFQSPSQMVSPVIAVSEIGVSAHRMILPIMEVSGSIWVLENVDR